MTFTTHQSTIHTIRQNDRNFFIQDNFTVTPRAGFEISRRCPENYQDLIQECIRHGWLKPVAHMTEREMLFIGLTDE
jgi:hypothetical protein